MEAVGRVKKVRILLVPGGCRQGDTTDHSTVAHASGDSLLMFLDNVHSLVNPRLYVSLGPEISLDPHREGKERKATRVLEHSSEGGRNQPAAPRLLELDRKLRIAGQSGGAPC